MTPRVTPQIRRCDNCEREFDRGHHAHQRFCCRDCARQGARSGPARRPFVDRYWSHVHTAGNDECWLWNGKSAPLYASLEDDEGRSRDAHRVAWELAYGSIPDGLFVLHRCDIQRCCNPAHLFLGTHADNMADKRRKDRHIWGERSPVSKLTDAQRLEIGRRVTGRRGELTELAREYGVEKTTVGRIAAGLRPDLYRNKQAARLPLAA